MVPVRVGQANGDDRASGDLFLDPVEVLFVQRPRVENHDAIDPHDVGLGAGQRQCARVVRTHGKNSLAMLHDMIGRGHAQ